MRSVREPSCGRPFFPEGHFNRVPPAAVQACLRQVFSRFGRPKIVRVDNGSPWGSPGDLPPEFALWLIGLGIDVLWNPPRRPQDNGVVERGQGLAKQWAEPHLCHSAAQLQRRLNREDRVQREHYPSIAGQPRWTAYPELACSGRPYAPAWERAHWDWSRVAEHLSGYAVRRRVDCSGKIGLYHHKLYVGTMHSGRLVYVQFDSERHESLVSNVHGCQVHRTPATMLTAWRVRHLHVSSPLP
jgi:hypothetical protein